MKGKNILITCTMLAEVTILWDHNLANCHIIQIMVLRLTCSFWVQQKELKITPILMHINDMKKRFYINNKIN